MRTLSHKTCLVYIFENSFRKHIKYYFGVIYKLLLLFDFSIFCVLCVFHKKKKKETKVFFCFSFSPYL